MKTKKAHNKQVEHMAIPLHQKAASGISKRREEKNKQNNAQITQPLESLIYHSKEFILSRESFNKNSRPCLKEIAQNTNIDRPLKTQEQELFDRRLSLKCTKNFSQQLESQKSHRLSVAPERRSSMTSNDLPQSFLERDSTISYYQNSNVRRQSRERPEIKKEAIMTNLMNKLGHQEDLRSIIESKLKSGLSSSQCFSKDRRNQSYITDFTQDNGVSSKLRKCESEIKYFKNVIKQMSERIIELSSQGHHNFKKKENTAETPKHQNQENNFIDIFKQLSSICTLCEHCKNGPKKQTKQIAIQTSIESEIHRPISSSNFDFLDNLQKTLKVLDAKKL